MTSLPREFYNLSHGCCLRDGYWGAYATIPYTKLTEKFQDVAQFQFRSSLAVDASDCSTSVELRGVFSSWANQVIGGDAGQNQLRNNRSPFRCSENASLSSRAASSPAIGYRAKSAAPSDTPIFLSPASASPTLARSWRSTLRCSTARAKPNSTFNLLERSAI
jgi:hypothetical protein